MVNKGICNRPTFHLPKIETGDKISQAAITKHLFLPLTNSAIWPNDRNYELGQSVYDPSIPVT